MKRINYFFKRREFDNPEIDHPFYEYRGYFFISGDGKKDYPVSIHFGRDELSICFREHVSGRIHKVFSLYVVEGELNQKKLSSQVENYWKMPVWPLNRNIKDINGADLYFETGTLCKYVGIDIADDKFLETDLFKKKADPEEYEITGESSGLKFFHNNDPEKTATEQWKVDDGRIFSNKINFRKILLDFLFEIDFANTFEDKNFFQLQKALQNNRTLDALTRKLCYIIELTQLKDHKQESSKPKLPAKFKTAEKQWLNVCFLEDYKEVFESRNSIYKSPEEEAELVLFKTQIGDSRKPRSKLFVKEDSHLRNQAASFFLRKYSIFNAFRTLLPTVAICSIPVLLLLMPLGDFCLSVMPWELPKNVIGISSIGIPVLLLATLIIHYFMSDINLFKLLLPRMFLGIMLGWSVFWGGDEFWRAAVTANAHKILITSTVIFVLIFLYIFTDIRNKLVGGKNRMVIARTTGLLLFAILISFVQGYYVLQFQAKPMLENSGFLITPKIISPENLKQLEKQEKKGDGEINNIDIFLKSKKQEARKLWGISNFSSPPTFTGGNLYYIWSIHFSQLMMSILIGIVLQLLWEDRPITEPL